MLCRARAKEEKAMMASVYGVCALPLSGKNRRFAEVRRQNFPAVMG
jgi:hypothetical protein